MFERIFDCPFRVKALRNGPSGPILESFAEVLCEAGYAEITTRRHIRAAEHFIYWADQESMSIASLSEKCVEQFEGHLDRCRCRGYGRSQRLELLYGTRLFLTHLRRMGVITALEVEAKDQDPVLLTAFCQWMRQQRGTRDVTLDSYSLYIRELLQCLGEDPGRFKASSLRQFILGKSQQCGRPSARKCTTALRMFLRFLVAEGRCPDGLDAAIPILAHWRLSTLPRYLQPEEVERIITSCNRNSPVGRRDRAILLLLSRLGLRAGEIIRLHLGDIDWKGARIHIRGKGGRQDWLPLTREVGDALVDYLQNGRPSTKAGVLFTRSRAPFCAFVSHTAISELVARAMRRAGITCQSRGAAHVLRHSAATSMLRQGALLQDIATILRHRSIETTQIYAKVDVTTLRQIAQPWPEVQPC